MRLAPGFQCEIPISRTKQYTPGSNLLPFIAAVQHPLLYVKTPGEPALHVPKTGITGWFLKGTDERGRE